MNEKINVFFDKEILKEALKYLKEQGDISDGDSETFYQRSEIFNFDGEKLKISLPSLFYVDRFNGAFRAKLEKTISDFEGCEISLTLFEKPKSSPIANQNNQLNQTNNTSAIDSYIDEVMSDVNSSSATNNENPPTTNHNTQNHVKALAKDVDKRQRPKDLNNQYRFETFVPGENSDYAFRILKWIAENPDGSKYNPCLIYGEYGIGKTHLLKAVGNYIFDNHPNLNIKFFTARQIYENVAFISSGAGKNGSKNNDYEIKQMFNDTDVLLIDDIQALENKNSTQEHLYLTLDYLYNNNKPIIFTCDKPINQLKNISPRLLNRFAKSTIADLQPPEYETRCAIIKHKLVRKNKFFPDDVIDLIAKNIINVRELESAIDSLEAYADMTGKVITLDLAKTRIKTQLQNSGGHISKITISLVQKIISDYFSISIQELKGKKKTKSIVYPRQLAMYIIRQTTEFSTTEIGMEFGGRDHSTVMHACDKIENLKKSDPHQDSTIQHLIRAIRENSDDKL